MAEWSYAANDPATVKLYSHRLFAQAIQSTRAYQLAAIGASKDAPDNVVQLMDETSKTEGDTIKYDLVAKIQGPGVIGDNTLAGQEVVPQTVQDALIINQLRQAILVNGAMSQQRVPFSMRDKAKMGLSDWWAERLDVGLLNQLCGNTHQTDTRYTGLNAVQAPSTGYQIFANGRTAETQLVAGDGFTMDLIDDYVAKAHSFTTPIKPIRLKGMEVFGVAFLHTFQIRSLRKNFSQGQWGDIQLAAMQGGQITGNPIFTGAIGMYNNVIIHEDNHVPWGSDAQAVDANGYVQFNALGLGGVADDGANIARGVICGAQAAVMAFGRGFGIDTRMRWFEELLDGGNQLRITAGLIFGTKKNRVNIGNTDYAAVTVSSFETNS